MPSSTHIPHSVDLLVCAALKSKSHIKEVVKRKNDATGGRKRGRKARPLGLSEIPLVLGYSECNFSRSKTNIRELSDVSLVHFVFQRKIS